MPQRFVSKNRSILSQLVLLVSAVLLISLGLNVVAMRVASKRVADQTNIAVNDNVSRYIVDALRLQVGHSAGLLRNEIQASVAEVSLLGRYWQDVLDERAYTPRLDAALNELPPVALTRLEPGFLATRWGEESETSVQAETSLGLRPSPLAANELVRSRLLDFLLPTFFSTHAEKLAVAWVGPRGTGLKRAVPGVAARAVDDGVTHPNLERLTEIWREGVPGGTRSFATFATPYRGPLGLATTILYPVWTTHRRELAGVAMLEVSLERIFELLDRSSVGTTGFAFVSQQNGQVLHLPALAANRLGLSLGAQSQGTTLLRLDESPYEDVRALNNTVFGLLRESEVVAGDEQFVVMSQRIDELDFFGSGLTLERGNWTVHLAVPKNELYDAVAVAKASLEEVSSAQLRRQWVSAAAVLLVMLLTTTFFIGRTTRTLRELSAAAQRIVARDFTTKVAVESTDEISELATAFNTMSAQIDAHTRELEDAVAVRTAELSQALDHLRSENTLATEIRASLVPSTGRMQHLDVGFAALTGRPMGGDYADVFMHEGHVWMIAGSVSGHGVPAGLLSMMLQTAVRASVLTLDKATAPLSPAELLTQVNGALHDNLSALAQGQYVTASAVRLCEGEAVAAGLYQDLLVLRRKENRVDRVRTEGVWLGLQKNISGLLDERVFTLGPRDMLLIASGGAFASLVNGAALGIDGVADLFVELAKETSGAQNVLNGLMGRISGTPLSEDRTLVCVERCEL